MKMRLDAYLVEKGMASDLALAQALIYEGKVFLGLQRLDNPSVIVQDSSVITLKQDKHPYVGRGGLKLEKALDVFGIDLNGVIAMDVGASTGGFTDCMLRRGAKSVYAIDVGYGLLDYKLRSDPRVIVMERQNARFLEAAMFAKVPSFASMDVSFISLNAVLPSVTACLSVPAQIVALVKPQFEAKKEQVGKAGIISDPKVHLQVLHDAFSTAVRAQLMPLNVTTSPIRGAKGNVEFLLYMQTNKEAYVSTTLLEQAHAIVYADAPDVLDE